MLKRICAVLSVGILLLSATADAEVRLPKILASHMVLQRDAEVTLWGWAEAGEEVTVVGDWLPKPVKTKADADGTWQVQVKTGKAGGPHKITIAGENTLALEDVLFGEVWIGSGQSNMEMPMIGVSRAYTAVKDSAKEVAMANYPQIRLFQVGNASCKEPQDDVQAGVSVYGVPKPDCQWAACSPGTVKTFSSTSYFFARELHKQLNVPIGMIDSSWGASSAEEWTPLEVLQKLGYPGDVKNARSVPENLGHRVSTRLYNGMIHPLRRMKIKGVIWYQGESNAGRANKYRELFAAMIESWRERFGGEPFSFYFAELAPCNYGKTNVSFLREAQRQTLALEKTGMASTIDIGNMSDVHPKNKQEVGRRLALWALANDYGQDIVYSGPLYKGYKIEGDKIRIQFSNIGGGLTTRDGKAPSHFSIAEADKQFKPANAVIEGAAVVVSAKGIAAPKFVRMAFNNASVPNLINKEGLPTPGFRTDSDD